MIFIYQISIRFYFLAIKISSLFNPKAKLWLEGRKNIFSELEKINSNELYWFHCASLGELEQGKPIIEMLKYKNPNINILLTFFSPSGYEYGKNYEQADYVFYLPLDTPSNANLYVDLIKPKKVFFIKYEFWYNYLFQLKNRNIPTYLISGVFRKDQVFFKWYGKAYKKMLSYFTYFFVQDIDSKNILNHEGYQNVSVTGDTRLDRVYQNSVNPEKPALINKFKNNKPTIILGSSWPFEEKIIAEFIHSTKKDFKYIIAPHNIEKKHLKEIEELLGSNFIKYSEATYENISSFKTLIIDNIGILANTYQFTDIAFIGGGFTGNLHNILEPASFGNAILFGPKHKKFHEASELIKRKAAFEIEYLDDLIAITNHFLLDNNLENAQQASLDFVLEGKGATEKIIKELFRI